jgi:hypothetical protein
MKILSLRMGAVFLALSFISTQVLATPVKWTIDAIITPAFGSPTGPAPVTGSFTFDVFDNSFSDINIVIGAYTINENVAPRRLPSARALQHVYTGELQEIIPGGKFGIRLISLVTFDEIDEPILIRPGEYYESEMLLRFGGELTNNGGTFSVTGTEAIPYASSVISGSISAVPVPAALWLFGSALAGLGWLRRKQKA